MTRLEREIELYLEGLVQRLEMSLHHAREALCRFREHHGKPVLSEIEISFQFKHGGHHHMSTSVGSVTLTTAGQVATARISRYIDQNGKDMPAGFVPPEISFSVDDTEGKVVKVVDNGDDTATITAVGNGSATLTATLTSAEGKSIVKTAGISVSIAQGEAPVLTDIEISFDS